MGNEIPTKSRRIVAARSMGRCERCGVGNPTDLHHRRSRSIRDEHCHCPCNLIHACRRCHEQIHREVAQARERGHIVSRYVPEPREVAFRRYDRVLVTLDCGGAWFVAQTAISEA